MSELDYERDIIIDESALDLEFLEQARLFMQYSRNEHSTRRDMDYAKTKLDLVKAKLDKEIRAHPEAFDVARISEGAIMNNILLQPEFEAANKTFIEATYESGVARAAVWAFDQRKTALENLVRLHGQQYFAGPRVPRDLSEVRQQRQEHSNQKVGRGMKRNKAGGDD
ncbi:hypothetical protein LCGC14_1057200 [marine sediment metagenome]|uniref:Uncharacterized protein n=1 Tax=marine sediment metagenome TaxID=412755 RepID=A0A0F9QT60_9ZZZZ